MLNSKISTFMAVTGQNYEGLKVIKHGYNVDLCTTDENYFNFQGFFHHLGVPFVTKTQHYKLTKDVVNRIVWAKWISQRSKIVADLKVNSRHSLDISSQSYFLRKEQQVGSRLFAWGMQGTTLLGSQLAGAHMQFWYVHCNFKVLCTHFFHNTRRMLQLDRSSPSG